MFDTNISKILEIIGPADRVLDIGGWAQPFNRANYVLDINPWHSRGRFGSYGPGPECFTRETWIQRDICARSAYSFPDKYFDYVICSHTLEDVRDPVFVCSEINRIGKRGYVEVPSRRSEMTLGVENRRYAGRSHHRWLVEIDGDELIFTFKYHSLHSHWRYHFPRDQGLSREGEKDIQFLFWDAELKCRENILVMSDEIDRYLANYVKARSTYPSWRYGLHDLKQKLKSLWHAARS